MDAPLTVLNLLASTRGLAPPLPAPPVLEALVLEQPLIPAIGLGLLGFIVLWAMLQRQNLKAAFGVGGAMVLLAGVMLVAGSAVTTTREALAADTRAFVLAALDGEVEAVSGMLADRVTISAGGETVRDDARSSVLSAVSSVGGAQVSERSVRVRGATLDGSDRARTQFTATIITRYGRVYTTWNLGWYRFADGWRVERFEGLTQYGERLEANDVRKYFR
ncbi:MAG: hypothetical protein AAGD00_00880 [Planctomycetota bacterium]